MRFIPTIFVSLIDSTALAKAVLAANYEHGHEHDHEHSYLTVAEANDIATRWLHLWDSNAVSGISGLTSILPPNITSYDEAFGGPIFGYKHFSTPSLILATTPHSTSSNSLYSPSIPATR
ncbi:hypothetical protein K432DRAFT_379809 [Lepidopterella palustris CBS 459.81]|uniref:Uncharacterized protein n=1 Tax=Lepidopterella palustris CBS 459.81 TaxID=1314670 RepID=A0A8E2JID6_9PEZI|nr:hypothetical protein K432DRAFT_379809 [Lepidopterella palustris CBS 459.81]